MTSKIVNEVIAANDAYVSGFGAKGNLALPPARGFAILTCMDARLDPAKYAGLSEGDAHVIRNAGARASDDAIRSLVISHKLLGTKEWFVIHHTNCGMELFCDDVMSGLLDDSLATASLDVSTMKWSNPQHGGGCAAGHFIKWHTIKNQEEDRKSVV
jgi:carbonic anhydrase